MQYLEGTNTHNVAFYNTACVSEALLTMGTLVSNSSVNFLRNFNSTNVFIGGIINIVPTCVANLAGTVNSTLNNFGTTTFSGTVGK